MSVSNVGIGSRGLGLPANPLRTGAGEEKRPTQAPAQRATQAPARAPENAPQGVAQGAQGAVPAEAPAGTDPALWSVLTSEERMFFAKFQTMGPLTYGPRTPAPQQAIPRGGRLDVRV
jgi:hypothetical protein